jgi:hypothetical protein
MQIARFGNARGWRGGIEALAIVAASSFRNFKS